ncbi:unnamed protein product [Urochloa humidicola]
MLCGLRNKLGRWVAAGSRRRWRSADCRVQSIWMTADDLIPPSPTPSTTGLLPSQLYPAIHAAAPRLAVHAAVDPPAPPLATALHLPPLGLPPLRDSRSHRPGQAAAGPRGDRKKWRPRIRERRAGPEGSRWPRRAAPASLAVTGRGMPACDRR